MTSIHGAAATTGPIVATRVVDAAEALCFARDLGGSLTHVVVAAAGRALSSDPILAEDMYEAGVGLAVPSECPVGVAVVHGARDALLPRLRAEVDTALAQPDEAVDAATSGRVAIVVVGIEATSPPAPELLRRARCVLETAPGEGGPMTLGLTLHADRASLDDHRAEELLGRIVRLLERPYRRLA